MARDPGTRLTRPHAAVRWGDNWRMNSATTGAADCSDFIDSMDFANACIEVKGRESIPTPLVTSTRPIPHSANRATALSTS